MTLGSMSSRVKSSAAQTKDEETPERPGAEFSVFLPIKKRHGLK
jgi:hypothetical protein